MGILWVRTSAGERARLIGMWEILSLCGQILGFIMNSELRTLMSDVNWPFKLGKGGLGVHLLGWATLRFSHGRCPYWSWWMHEKDKERKRGKKKIIVWTQKFREEWVLCSDSYGTNVDITKIHNSYFTGLPFGFPLSQTSRQPWSDAELL